MTYIHNSKKYMRVGTYTHSNIIMYGGHIRFAILVLRLLAINSLWSEKTITRPLLTQ